MNKLHSIFFYLLNFLLHLQKADAQIIYTDVNPDISLSASNSQTNNLDINNDGINDFQIIRNIVLSGVKYDTIKVVPLNNNEVLTTSAFSPKALDSNKIINAGSTFWRHDSIMSMASEKIKKVCAPCFESCKCGRVWMSAYNQQGSWKGKSKKYLGIKVYSGSNTYYGWIGMTVISSPFPFSAIIFDYAYDSTPNHSIHAGATTGARYSDEDSIIENDLKLSVFPNPTSNSTTIFFSISKPQNVSLKIFDLNGRLVSTLADKIFEEGENKLILYTSDVNAGIYFLQFQSSETLQMEKLIVTK